MKTSGLFRMAGSKNHMPPGVVRRRDVLGRSWSDLAGRGPGLSRLRLGSRPVIKLPALEPERQPAVESIEHRHLLPPDGQGTLGKNICLASPPDQVAGPGYPHLLDQPVLQRLEDSLHPAFGLRRVGVDDPDAKLCQSPLELCLGLPVLQQFLRAKSSFADGPGGKLKRVMMARKLRTNIDMAGLFGGCNL